MGTTIQTAPSTTAPIDLMRRTSLAAGILYLLTFVSIPTLALYQDARGDADFVLGAGSDSGVPLAVFSEVVVAVTCIGTAVVLFPVIERQSETAAIGFVASRVTEGALILVGVVSVLTLLTLRTDVAGTAEADPKSLVTAGHALSAAYDWTFLFSQSLVLWYTVGAHHVVRPEDWPVMPVTRVGFHLKPFGFFDGNPMLDLPPEGSHCAPTVPGGSASGSDAEDACACNH